MATKAPAKTAAKGGKKKTFKKKEKKMVPVGVVHVQASFNNTIITITDPMGNVLSWSSSGSLGFRGSRKGTPFAAQQASLTAANKAADGAPRFSPNGKLLAYRAQKRPGNRAEPKEQDEPATHWHDPLAVHALVRVRGRNRVECR